MVMKTRMMLTVVVSVAALSAAFAFSRGAEARHNLRFAWISEPGADCEVYGAAQRDLIIRAPVAYSSNGTSQWINWWFRVYSNGSNTWSDWTFVEWQKGTPGAPAPFRGSGSFTDTFGTVNKVEVAVGFYNGSVTQYEYYPVTRYNIYTSSAWHQGRTFQGTNIECFSFF
jgi:hypothetical protein